MNTKYKNHGIIVSVHVGLRSNLIVFSVIVQTPIQHTVIKFTMSKVHKSLHKITKKLNIIHLP